MLQLIFKYGNLIYSSLISSEFSVHPLIQVPNQLVAAPKGDSVVLECAAEASPKAINYWTRDTGKISLSLIKFTFIH